MSNKSGSQSDTWTWCGEKKKTLGCKVKSCQNLLGAKTQDREPNDERVPAVLGSRYDFRSNGFRVSHLPEGVGGAWGDAVAINHHVRPAPASVTPSSAVCSLPPSSLCHHPIPPSAKCSGRRRNCGLRQPSVARSLLSSLSFHGGSRQRCCLLNVWSWLAPPPPVLKFDLDCDVFSFSLQCYNLDWVYI